MEFDLTLRKPLNILILNEMAEMYKGDEFFEKFKIQPKDYGVVNLDIKIKVNDVEVDITKQYERYLQNILNKLDRSIEEKARELVKDQLIELERIIFELKEFINYMDISENGKE